MQVLVEMITYTKQNTADIESLKKTVKRTSQSQTMSQKPPARYQMSRSLLQNCLQT